MKRWLIALVLIITLWNVSLTSPIFSTPMSSKQQSSTWHQENSELSNHLSMLTAELTYSTYFGGSDSESNIYTVTDNNGNLWVTGATLSENLPTTPDAHNRTHAGSFDIFVIKLDRNNCSLIYSTYIGGSGYELPMAIEIDSSNNVWICGETGSGDFPTTLNAFNSTLNGAVDMFILELSGNNGSLLYSSYVGGSGGDSALSIDFDSDGNVWATGITNSDNFPTLPTSLYKVYNGSNDAVLFQLAHNGTSLLYSTYIGGTDDDRGYKILVDSSDDVWVAGSTNSFDFPVTQDAYKNTSSGGSDIYLLKLDHHGGSIVYSTYFGGSAQDSPSSLVIDTNDNIWGTGSTSSGNFPTTPDAFDQSYGGSYDCIVFQFANNGSTLQYSTYLGSSGQDQGRSISLDRNNAVWISGDTTSDTFPTTSDAFNQTFSGVRDAFLLSLAPNGTDLYYSTFLGGSNSDSFASVAVGSAGSVWIVGQTRSADFPTTETAFNRTLSGSEDLFVTSFVVFSAPDPPVNLSVIESVEHDVILLWEEPEYDGNSEVTHYRVYRNTSQDEFDTALGETIYEYFLDNSTLPDLDYHYVITAVNEYGESVFSDSVNITITTLTFRPGAPQNLSATAEDGFIYLNWSVPLDDGGSPISVYHIYRRAFDESFNRLATSTNVFFNDISAIEGVLYHYKVTAENEVGESVGSSEVTARIPDTTLPTINHPSDISYVEGELGNSITWTPTDMNPALFSIDRNETTVISGGWLGGAITINVDLLPKGNYLFNCTVIDQSGNWVSDVVVVVVSGVEPTTPINGDLGVAVLILGGGVTGVLLVVVLLATRKKLSS